MAKRGFSRLSGARLQVLLAAALLAAALAAPVTAGEAAEAAPPGRVVSLVPAITETLFALGLGPRVVGVSSYCDYPPEARSLPKVGTFSEPVAEAIVTLHPDLVLTSPSPGNETSVRAVERSGIRVAVVQSEGGLGESRAAMLAVADAVGEHEAGLRLVGAIDARIAAVGARAAALAHPVAAVVVGREPLVLAGPASYLGELLVLAGGRNVADPVGGRWPQVGIEFLVAAAPQVLVDLSIAMGDSPRAGIDAPSSWASLSSLPAVASGRVVTDRASLMLRPGPRLGDAAEALFEALHPQSPAGTGAQAPKAAQ